jgi:hypothetical protein
VALALAAAAWLHACGAQHAHDHAAQHDGAVRGSPGGDAGNDAEVDARDGAAPTRPDGSAVGQAGGNPSDSDPPDASVGPADGGPAPEDPIDGSAALDAGVLGDAAGLPEQPLPYAEGVLEFMPGTNAGFGEVDFPDIVLGPPRGAGSGAGSLHVLSLGVGGSIALDFGARAIVDGAGPDFVVFENAFWPGGDQSQVFAVPGEVAVSEDGESWHVFPCNPQATGEARFAGCAGVTPTLRYDAAELLPLDPEQSGGDAFDLAELGLESARYVRVRDLSGSGTSNNAGFDLDAIGLIHYAADGDE